jgi:flagellar biosynthesis/type III secretory pathway protein FliH
MATGSRILKGAAPVPGRRVEAAVFDADRRVREMVASAREECRRLRAEAEAARGRLVAEATEEGRREGQARAAAALAIAALERDRLLRDAEGEIVALALAVARKILGRELASAPSAVVHLAAAALAEARERRQVMLRVSPKDAAEIRAAAGGLAAALSRAPLEIREDPALGAGDAVVDTEAGRVDARIEAQLAAIARAIEEAAP